MTMSYHFDPAVWGQGVGKQVVAAIGVGVVLSLAPAIVPLSRWSRLIDREMVEPFVQVACLSLLLLSLSQLIANEFVAFLYFRF